MHGQPLDPTYVYQFGVTAVNSVGPGSGWVATPGASPGAAPPAPPSTLTVTSHLPNAANLSWTTVTGPGPSGGSPVFQYDVSVVTNGTQVGLVPVPVPWTKPRR